MGEAKRRSLQDRLKEIEDSFDDGFGGGVTITPSLGFSPQALSGITIAREFQGKGKQLLPGKPEDAVLMTVTCPTCGLAIKALGNPPDVRFEYPAVASPCQNVATLGNKPEALGCQEFYPTYMSAINDFMAALTKRASRRRQW